MAKTKKKKKNKEKKVEENDDGEIILSKQKGPKENGVVKIEEYKGNVNFKIMQMCRNDEDVEADNYDWKHSKKIISFTLDDTNGKSQAEKFVKKFIKALKNREW